MGQGKVDCFFVLICTVALGSVVALVSKLKIAVALAPVLINGALTLFLLLVAIIYSWRDPRVARVARVAFWAVVFTSLFELPIYFMFRLRIPFRDAALASADRMLGLKIPSLILYVDRFPRLESVSGCIYNSLTILVAVALLLPAILDQINKSNEFLFGVIFCVVATLITLSFFQAVGPWVPYPQVIATHVQRAATAMLYSLKAGNPVIFNLGYPAPLVALPSWHSIFAVLSAVALARVRIVRGIAAAWTTLILVSCITTGWHYASDVLAGVGMSLLSAYAARRVELRFNEKPDARPDRHLSPVRDTDRPEVVDPRA